MAENVLVTGLALHRQKATGEALSEFGRDALVGNPRDPLIGFPIIFQITANPKLTTEN
jgi:hypothetical protein